MSRSTESDVDVGVMLYDDSLAQYPEGKKHSDFGNSDANYPFTQFKNELEEALWNTSAVLP